ncbi:sulfotransferase family 2 domain-containing protein [Pleurocapsa sp. PCC 7319]|uniref:sulfotransferase family 2 domain-containing protein n=1 Tax=Pleurocapsa sp. PCC 7319 TaxID=118161 RepID=UPI00034565C6|nr:sulfotransferase family 2 domain-containing protein [Pleurocapsa sp. PCC 7319]
MHISYADNFLFIHTPKCAGSSIQQALKITIFKSVFKFKKSAYELLIHEIDQGFFINALRNPFTYDNVTNKVGRHAWAKRLKRELGDEKYSKLFKFAFVRNPWDWEVSWYKYISKSHAPIYQNHPIKSMSFEEYIEWITNDTTKSSRKYLRSQKNIITDEKGKIIVDFVGRFENLQSDYNKICQIIDLPTTKLPGRNKSQKKKTKTYKDYYNDKTKDLIYNYHREDIDLFGYSF